MKKCSNCQTSLLPNARFCHNCGAKVVFKENITCPHCQTTNPKNAAFCKSCGYFFNKKKSPQSSYIPIYQLDFQETNSIAPTLEEYFFEAFKKNIKEEQDPQKYPLYRERFQEADFSKNFDLRINQLAEEAYSIHSKQEEDALQKIDQRITFSFNNLLDHFIILYCKDLNITLLSEDILNHHHVKKEATDLQSLILDYLDLENEKEEFYIDFVKMPVSKLRNSSKAFLFPEKDEKILLITDQTIFGSCKEGFALTEKGIYWKAHFEKAKKVFFADLHSIKKEKEWITINGHFFNVNPSVNIKMMKLLRKIKLIYLA